MKLVVGLFALMLAVGAASFWTWRTAPLLPSCTDAALAFARSVDGRVEADLFEKRCGDSVTTHVALRPASARPQSHADVFVAAGSVRVRLSWNDAGELVIESPARRVLLEESSWRKVGIRLRRVR